MRLTFLILSLAAIASAQTPPAGSAGATPAATANLPAQAIGPNDLIDVSVYGAPEFSRTLRVGADGYIRLPILNQRIKAQGLLPADLESAIADAIRKGQFYVDPYVTVTIAEYHSRPISISGAVRAPTEFQATGPTPLLDVIAKAGGLSDAAGPEILVNETQPGPDGQPLSHTRRISVHDLINNADPDLNITLTGGEQVIVPEAARIYVVGNVKSPNAYRIQDGSETSVMKILALSGGLAQYAGKEAYISRLGAAGARTEIPVPLSKILARKSPDVPLVANDIFYVPDSKGKHISLTALTSMTQALTLASGVLIYSHP
jgi:polysaccharide export outer membrane protein